MYNLGILIGEGIFSDCIQCICLMHFPEWEYSLYTRAASRSVKTSPTRSKDSFFTPFHSSCHLLPLSLSWRTCSDTFSPQFPCDPTKTVFSVLSSPSIQQLLHLSTSIFPLIVPLLPLLALLIPPFLLGSIIPYKHLSCIISCRCCCVYMSSLCYIHPQHVNEETKVGGYT